MSSSEYQEELPKGQAAKRYLALTGDREVFLARARRVAQLTIASLFVAPGTKGQDIQDPNQGMGARGVNNLAAKLLLALFPPGMPFFKYQLGAAEKAQLEEASNQIQQSNPSASPQEDPKFVMNQALADRESLLQDEFEACGTRSVAYPLFRHLVVAGNVLLHFPNKGQCRYISLDNYVVKRDYAGNVLEIVVKEQVSFKTLPEATQAQVITAANKTLKPDDEVEVFTQVCRDTDDWDIHQEVHGVTVEDSQGTFPLEDPQFLALRWSRIDGEDYGRGYAEEYIPELHLLDKLQYALGVGIYVAAKTIGMVKPGSQTEVKDLQEAEPGDVIPGNPEDVGFVQSGKAQDYTIAARQIEAIKSDLGFVFLLNSTVPRNAERVTATEVQFVAQELEDSLGGIYSLFSKELQMPMATRLEGRLTKGGAIKPLPKGAVKAVIVTGLAALGRSHEVVRLKEAISDFSAIAGPQMTAMILKLDNIASDIFNGMGLKATTYVKTQAEIQQSMQQSLAHTAIGNAASAGATQVGQMMQNHQLANQGATPNA